MGNKINNNKKTSRADQFCIDFHHSQLQSTDINDTICTDIKDQRRIVFVSLIGLFNTYKKCPSFKLYSAIFILPIKKKWIYSKPESLTQNIVCSDVRVITEFISLLQWKDSQNLLLCMLDDYNQKYVNNPEEDCLVNPFWKYVSIKLSNLHDPATGSNYNPLILNGKRWQHYGKTKYNVNISNVLNELYYKSMNFKCMQEILYASNPLSLNPITGYNQHSKYRTVSIKSNGEILENDKGEWCISVLYPGL